VNGLKLPALKGLGSLADCEPIIVVDTREQTPLPFRRFQTRGGTLLSGDDSVAGLEHLFVVERKSIGDVVACCVGQNRERFERELHRYAAFGSSAYWWSATKQRYLPVGTAPTSSRKRSRVRCGRSRCVMMCLLFSVTTPQ
jgi:hypothetical protein